MGPGLKPLQFKYVCMSLIDSNGATAFEAQLKE
jgi:hypothetical protein